MAQVKFFKVTSLPTTLFADSLYFVVNGNYTEAYVTDTSGNAKAIGNSTMISSIAQNLINTSLADFNALEIAADINARNALATAKQRNFLVLVSNATGDSTVQSGAALYAWNEATAGWIKLSEYESMDLVLQWGNIQGRPSSSTAQIDDAVAKRHSHANSSILDGLNQDSNGSLTFNGSVVAVHWTTLGW